MFLADSLHGIAHGLLEHSHRFALALDKSHFKVETSCFGQMARCRTLLGAKYFGDGEGAFKRAHHYLFVKLRTRREVRFLIFEVLDLKDGCSSFCVAADECR